MSLYICITREIERTMILSVYPYKITYKSSLSDELLDYIKHRENQPILIIVIISVIILKLLCSCFKSSLKNVNKMDEYTKLQNSIDDMYNEFC